MAKKTQKETKKAVPTKTPVIKISFGVTDGEDYTWDRAQAATVGEAVKKVSDVTNKLAGKGLREVILSFHSFK